MNAPLPVAVTAGGAVRLGDWGLIRARGADAATFLHAQLTQDIAHLPPSQARLAGYCSAKGRLMASFVVWRSSPDELLLACSADLLAPTLKRLSMFVLRSRCKLDDASGEHALYGLVGERAREWLGDAAPAVDWGRSDVGAAQVVRLPAVDGIERHLLAMPADAPPPDLPAVDADVWRWLEVRSGIVRIVAATAEQFVPQMVNFELVGGVNFQKGCYPGQEIVARSQYRGTVKRRARLFEVDVPLQPGQEVVHSDDPGQPAGLVALAASLGADRHVALVECKNAALDVGTLHVGGVDGPALRPANLPYAVVEPGLTA